jgi:hypothetical protein
LELFFARPGAISCLSLGRRWIGGISDGHQVLCFALALWNGNDAILKERLFGLNNSEGNHGEDVKEYYFYLDSTPTHSYMKYLLMIGAGATQVVRLCLTRTMPAQIGSHFVDFDTVVKTRLQEADAFYAAITPAKVKPDTDRANVMRQALAGMLWTKQYFDNMEL